MTAAGCALFVGLIAVLATVLGPRGVALASGIAIVTLEIARHLAARRVAGVSLPANLARTGFAGALAVGVALGARSLIAIEPLAEAAAAGALFTAVYWAAQAALGFRFGLRRVA